MRKWTPSPFRGGLCVWLKIMVRCQEKGAAYHVACSTRKQEKPDIAVYVPAFFGTIGKLEIYELDLE